MNPEQVKRAIEIDSLRRSAESLVAAAEMLGLVVTIESKVEPLDPKPKMVIDIRGTRGKDF